MKRRIRQLTTDEELASILPMVWLFTVENGGPTFAHHVEEILLSLKSEKGVTVVGWKDGEPKAYGCGYFVAEGEFCITQAFSGDPTMTKMCYHLLERVAKRRGARKMLLHTPHPPRLWERFGFKVARILMIKEVKDGR